MGLEVMTYLLDLANLNHVPMLDAKLGNQTFVHFFTKSRFRRR